MIMEMLKEKGGGGKQRAVDEDIKDGRKQLSDLSRCTETRRTAGTGITPPST